MAYQIDYIPVGDGERSGDAIALRFGNLQGPRSEQSIMVIDGGFKDSGELLVQHVKSHYGTDEVNLVVSTHPDADHASGLNVVLENLKVGQLAMHRPWEHAADIKHLFQDGRITASGLEDRLEKSLQHASDLEAIATKKGIPIVEPFQGITGFGGTLRILGPSQEYYETLLAGFRSTPVPVAGLGILAPFQRAVETVVRKIEDSMGIDILNDDEDTTSAENNTSVIMLLEVDGHKLLFTGDAGKTALLNAITYAEGLGIALTGMSFLDVPHHGSKRNINSKILKRMSAGTAFISASAESEKHPAKKVTNALKKHGMDVYVNRDKALLHHYNAPSRPGWGPAIAEPFHLQVEE
ncbi:MAG: MBL fold metallo-hydrolase [Candidatus Paceibacterota bacterium]|jgi:beta-lactamase superfamily II metal-dependent hydrolase